MNNNVMPAKINKLNVIKADWSKFKTSIKINNNILLDVDTVTETITNIIINAAEQNILRLKTNIK